MNLKNYKNKLPSEIIYLIDNLVQCSKNQKINIFFVGGLVRDLIMGKSISDVDILVEGNAIDFVKLVPNAEIISIHEDFGTVKAKVFNLSVDFASTREETYPNSGCLPVVRKIGCPISDDLKRRDFTINAIAINLETFEMIDIFNGFSDIQTHTLKILHENSFIDDPTRILRGLDFSMRFNFTYDNETQIALNTFLNPSPSRDYLSFSRVELTLKKLIKNSSDSYKNILENNLYKIFRDTKPIDFDTLNMAIEKCEANKEQVQFMALTAENFNIDYDKNSLINMYKTFKKYSNEELALHYAISLDNNILDYINEIQNIKLSLTGADIINLGYKQGKIIGEILDKILEYKIKNRIFSSSKKKEIEIYQIIF